MQHSDIFMIVADECHCITEWGYTFRDAYLHISNFIGKLKRKPVICACSATISADSLNTIRDSLHMDKPTVLRSDLRRDNLILLKKDVTCNKKTLEERLEFRIKKLCKLIDKYHKDGSVLFFATFRFNPRVIAGNIARVYFFQNVVQRIYICSRLRKDQHRAIFVILIN